MVRFFTAGSPVVAAVDVALIVYYFCTRGIFQGKASGDGFFGFMLLPGLLLHHSFDMALPIPEWVGALGRERTGLVANGCPIGPAFFWVVPYVLGLLLQKLCGVLALLPLGAHLLLAPTGRLTGREELDFFMAGLGSLLAGMIGIRLMHDVVRRRLSRGAADFAAATVGLATPLSWYMVSQPLYQHAGSFFGVALFIERWDAWRDPGGRAPMPLRRWVVLGALGGVAMLMRQQDGLFLLLPGLDALLLLMRAARARDAAVVRRTLVGGVLFLLSCAVVYSPQLLLWRHYYGAFRPPQDPGHFRWRDPAIVESLFSLRGGLFPWVPLLYLAVPGLWLVRRRLNGLAWRLALVCGLELWLNASVWDFYASWTYGPRRYTDAMVVAGLGLGGVWAWAAAQPVRRARWLRGGLVVAAVLAMLFNLLMMELVRTRKVKSSGAGAFPPAVWVKWAQGPAWLERALSQVAYPFAQPAGWIWGMIHHVPARTFDAVVGNYLLERDWRSHGFLGEPALHFAQQPPYVVEGLAAAPVGGWPGGAAVPCGSRVRILVPLMGREPLRLRLHGELRGGEAGVRVQWNGAPVAVSAGKDLLTVSVPKDRVQTRARTNELVFEGLPAGAALRRLELESYTAWWRE